MAILLDTNVLLRLVQRRHSHSALATHATNTLDARNETMLIAHQNIVEFWSVATRPFSANGLGFTIEDAEFELDGLKKLFRILPELPVHEEWQRVVVKYRISGKSVHDARLVAAMIVHGVGEILTFNMQDFTRYTEIAVLDPVNVT
jgi:predicted nucleic acid-binding protein